MELTTKQVELRKLTASEGMYLTQVNEVEARVFSPYIYLAEGDAPENWREATKEEKEACEAEEDRRMQEKINNLNTEE